MQPRSRLGFREETQNYAGLDFFSTIMSLYHKNSLHVIFVCFKRSLLGVKFAKATPRLVSFRGHKKFEPHPDGLL